jgi:hypothetical protein
LKSSIRTYARAYYFLAINHTPGKSKAAVQQRHYRSPKAVRQDSLWVIHLATEAGQALAKKRALAFSAVAAAASAAQTTFSDS